MFKRMMCGGVATLAVVTAMGVGGGVAQATPCHSIACLNTKVHTLNLEVKALVSWRNSTGVKHAISIGDSLWVCAFEAPVWDVPDSGSATGDALAASPDGTGTELLYDNCSSTTPSVANVRTLVPMGVRRFR
jgi:hypothetical protein